MCETKGIFSNTNYGMVLRWENTHKLANILRVEDIRILFQSQRFQGVVARIWVSIEFSPKTIEKGVNAGKNVRIGGIWHCVKGFNGCGSNRSSKGKEQFVESSRLEAIRANDTMNRSVAKAITKFLKLIILKMIIRPDSSVG